VNRWLKGLQEGSHGRKASAKERSELAVVAVLVALDGPPGARTNGT
jgi:hypothetical protein